MSDKNISLTKKLEVLSSAIAFDAAEFDISMTRRDIKSALDKIHQIQGHCTDILRELKGLEYI